MGSACIGFKLAFVDDDGSGVKLGLHWFGVFGWEFEVFGKSFEGGSVSSSSMASGYDNKWLDLPTIIRNGSKEWGVFVNCLLCGCIENGHGSR